MEFLNNDGAHNLCEQDSNNFICIIHPLATVACVFFFFFHSHAMQIDVFFFSRFVQNNYKF